MRIILPIALFAAILICIVALKNAYAGDKFDPKGGWGGRPGGAVFLPGAVQGGDARMTVKPGAFRNTMNVKPGAFQNTMKVDPGALKNTLNVAPGAVQGGRGGQGGQGGRAEATIEKGAVDARSQAAAKAQVNVYGDQVPASQDIRIATVPGLGGLFVAGSAFPCVINAGGSGVFMEGGFQATGPILSRPCYLAYLAQMQMSAATVAYSVNQPEQVRPSLTNAAQLVNCGDETSFIASKATGYPCAVMPDRDALDLYMGGMPRPIVRANPGYIPPRPPAVHHDYGPIPNSGDDNPKYDRQHTGEMAK